MRLTREVMRGRMGADMARQPRIEYAGATYHVMARGNHGQATQAMHARRAFELMQQFLSFL
jgi:hypothetical protein